MYAFPVRLALSMVLLVAVCAVGLSADPITITIEEKTYKSGDTVMATLKAKGSVTLENDFKKLSEVVKVDGMKTVALGKITGSGFYVVRATDGTNSASAVLFVAPTAQKQTYECTVASGAVKPEVTEALMVKFYKGMTRERLIAAAKVAVKDWLKDNIGSLGTTTTLCIVCSVPGGQFACGACASSAGGNTIDLGIEVLRKLIDSMEKDGTLTKAEAGKLRTFVKIGDGLIALRDIKKTEEKIEKALEFMKLVIDQAFTEGNVQVVLGIGVDEAKKAAILIRLTKK
jgi:hypothetical protein